MIQKQVRSHWKPLSATQREERLWKQEREKQVEIYWAVTERLQGGQGGHSSNPQKAFIYNILDVPYLIVFKLKWD